MHNETFELESLDEELHKLCKELRDALLKGPEASEAKN